jgi:hypothetical protein
MDHLEYFSFCGIWKRKFFLFFFSVCAFSVFLALLAAVCCCTQVYFLAFEVSFSCRFPSSLCEAAGWCDW